jgi:hypothetical protein
MPELGTQTKENQEEAKATKWLVLKPKQYLHHKVRVLAKAPERNLRTMSSSIAEPKGVSN